MGEKHDPVERERAPHLTVVSYYNICGISLTRV